MLRIRDSGIGIPAAVLPKIFEPFQQGDESLRRTGGLGIGLALVRHLIGLHRGTISASSEGEGRGATFTICLPTLVSVDNEAEDAAAPVVSAPAALGSMSEAAAPAATESSARA